MDSPLYHEHLGTIRIAAISEPASWATKAIQMLDNASVDHVDFFCIGANASQQAIKILTLFRAFFEKNTNREQTLAFLPFHVHTMAPPLHGPKGAPLQKLNATVFRTMILSAEQTQQFSLSTEPTEKQEPKHEPTRKNHQGSSPSP